MLWDEMKWPEFKEIDRSTPVIIPLGACEQHGHHLPVFVDTIQVTEIAKCVESEMAGRVLLMPTMWLGSSHHHKDFPGTISVLPSLYSEIIKQITRSVLDAGFTRLFFLNGHGGNRVPAASALTELIAEDERANEAYLALASWWEVGGQSIHPKKLHLEQQVMGHACEYETSVMLKLRPKLVDMSKITQHEPVLENQWFHSEDDSRKQISVFRRFHRFTPSGFLGHPQLASPEKGQAILEGVVERVVAFIDDFSSWPELPPVGPA